MGTLEIQLHAPSFCKGPELPAAEYGIVICEEPKW